MLNRYQIQAIKDATKQTLWEHAKNAYPQTTMKDWVFHEFVIGDSTVTSPIPHDVDWKTNAGAGLPQFVIDAGDLTADDLTEILAAAETLENEQFIGIYGVFDLGLEAGELTGAADTPPSLGSIVSIRFEGGAGTLDFWQIGHLYAFENVVGFSDRPVIWEQNSAIKIKVCATEDTEDKSFGFRGYTLRKRGSLDKPYWDKSEPFAGGIDPWQELTQEQIDHIILKVQAHLYKRAYKTGVVSSLANAYAKGYLREIVGGDDSDKTDFVDFDQSSTAQTTGQQNWAQDSSVYTAGDLSNVMASGETVDKQKFVGIYGFYDLTSVPNALCMSWDDNGGRKDFWHVEHIYAYHTGGVAGITMRPVYYDQEDVFIWNIAVKVAKDTFIAPLGFIWELWGTTLSE